MNRINPAYIGVLLVMLLAMSLYLLNSAKDTLKESKQSFKETKKIATEIKSLKNAYANEVVTKKNIIRLLADKSLKSAEIKTEYKNSGVKISSKNMNKKALDVLMGKVLNSSYDVRSLKIKSITQEIAELELEIRW